MGKPAGTKNRMRTVEEKEEIVKKYLSGESATTLTKKYDLSNKIIYRWVNKYRENGINGLKSNTGKAKGGNKGLGLRKPKNREEELELKLLKKEIELIRLKKGYVVKGVGVKKEYVSILDASMK
jgi:transposase